MHKVVILLAVLLIAAASLLTVVDSKPTTNVPAGTPHVRRRRSAGLGDITAQASGILNEECKLPALLCAVANTHALHAHGDNCLW